MKQLAASKFKLTFVPFLFQNYILFPINFISMSFEDMSLTFERKIK